MKILEDWYLEVFVDDLRRAQIAFSQYHQRGLKACESLRNEDFDQALDSLMWRGAAYHNFKVYDERLRISGTDLGRDPKFLSLWKEVDENNTELEALLSIAKKKVVASLMGGPHFLWTGRSPRVTSQTTICR